MLKKLSLIVFLLANAAFANAQQFTAKDLIGRWQNARVKTGNIAFFTESTGAWLTNDGLLYNKMNYSTKARKDIIEWKFTIQPNRKHPSYVRFTLKFLNDSTLLMRYLWGVPKDADTSSKKVSVYTRIKKELPGTEMRYPDYKDLIGVWGSKLKDTTRFQKFTFVDTSLVYTQTSTQGLNKLRYVVDFKQQPIAVDMYYQNQLVKQCFIAFYNKDAMRIEFFNPGKRPDHFTFFGGNAHLYRDKKVDPALYQH
jgi:hypothetical protein